MTALAIFALLNALDAFLTVRVLKRGGAEANPVMRAAMERVGVVPALAAVKLVMLAIVYVAGNEWLTWSLCAAYALLCAWNCWVLSRL